MENNANSKAPVFTFSIVAIILGSALYKQFDFETLKFEKPALAALYGVVFIFSLIILVKHFMKKSEKK